MNQSGDIDREELTYILEDGPNLIRETQDGIQRIANIAADLKSFSHQGTDEQFLTDLRKCINTALNLARNELKYKVEIVRDFSETLPQIPCVESKITQVLLNLFVNASHAIQDNGQLTISTSCDTDFAIITVRDNGCGNNVLATPTVDVYVSSAPFANMAATAISSVGGSQPP